MPSTIRSFAGAYLSCNRRAFLHLITLPLPRFKESDELSLVFKYAFLVCSNHQFDEPPLCTAGALERQQSPLCFPTGSFLLPSIVRHFCFLYVLKFACSCCHFPQALAVDCLRPRTQTFCRISSKRRAGGFHMDGLSAEIHFCHCCCQHKSST